MCRPKPYVPSGCIAQAWSVAEALRYVVEDSRVSSCAPFVDSPAAPGVAGRRTRSARTLSLRKSMFLSIRASEAGRNGSGMTTDFASSCKQANSAYPACFPAGPYRDEREALYFLKDSWRGRRDSNPRPPA